MFARIIICSVASVIVGARATAQVQADQVSVELARITLLQHAPNESQIIPSSFDTPAILNPTNVSQTSFEDACAGAGGMIPEGTRGCYCVKAGIWNPSPWSNRCPQAALPDPRAELCSKAGGTVTVAGVCYCKDAGWYNPDPETLLCSQGLERKRRQENIEWYREWSRTFGDLCSIEPITVLLGATPVIVTGVARGLAELEMQTRVGRPTSYADWPSYISAYNQAFWSSPALLRALISARAAFGLVPYWGLAGSAGVVGLICGSKGAMDVGIWYEQCQLGNNQDSTICKWLR